MASWESKTNMLVNGDFEEEGGWTLINSAQIVQDAINAQSGTGCLRLTPVVKDQGNTAYQDVQLVPGNTYTLVFHIKVSAIIMLSMSPSVRIGYYRSDGVFSAITAPLFRMYEEYMAYEWSFTIPADAKDNPCRVFFTAMASSPKEGVHCFVDRAVLYEGAKDSDSALGRQGWVIYRDVDSYDMPAGNKTGERFMTHDWVGVGGQVMANGEDWYFCGDFFFQTGWIPAKYVGWVNPLQAAGKKYVRLLENRLWSVDLDFNRNAYYWPMKRRVLVQDYDASYYQTIYGGNISYVRKDQCEVLAQNAHPMFNDRIRYIAEAEVGRQNSRYYDNAQGDWSLRFCRWLSEAAWMPTRRLPHTGNIEEAIVLFNTGLWPGVTCFGFKNLEYKLALKQKYPALCVLSDDLSSYDRSVTPYVGCWIFLRLEENADHTIAKGKVAFVSRVSGSTVQAFEADMDDGTVKEATYEKTDPLIVGIGVLNQSLT